MAADEKHAKEKEDRKEKKARLGQPLQLFNKPGCGKRSLKMKREVRAGILALELESEEPKVRGQALTSLGSLSGVARLQGAAMAALIEDDDIGVRMAACRAVWAVGSEMLEHGAGVLLAERLFDPNETQEIQRVSQRALNVLGVPASELRRWGLVFGTTAEDLIERAAEDGELYSAYGKRSSHFRYVYKEVRQKYPNPNPNPNPDWRYAYEEVRQKYGLGNSKKRHQQHRENLIEPSHLPTKSRVKASIHQIQQEKFESIEADVISVCGRDHSVSELLEQGVRHLVTPRASHRQAQETGPKIEQPIAETENVVPKVESVPRPPGAPRLSTAASKENRVRTSRIAGVAPPANPNPAGEMAPPEDEEEDFYWKDGEIGEKTKDRLLVMAAGRSAPAPEPPNEAPREPRHKGGVNLNMVRRRVIKPPDGAGAGGRHRSWHQWDALRGCPATVREEGALGKGNHDLDMQQLLIHAYGLGSVEVRETKARPSDRCAIEAQLGEVV